MWDGKLTIGPVNHSFRPPTVCKYEGVLCTYSKILTGINSLSEETRCMVRFCV